MNHAYRISTGIDSLDQTLDYLRPGDNVTWQMESIGDYAFVATQFVTKIALTGKRIVYLRFGDHEELIPADALRKRGANIREYQLDPSVGFETFAVQVHQAISSEEVGSSCPDPTESNMLSQQSRRSPVWVKMSKMA